MAMARVIKKGWMHVAKPGRKAPGLERPQQHMQKKGHPGTKNKKLHDFVPGNGGTIKLLLRRTLQRSIILFSKNSIMAFFKKQLYGDYGDKESPTGGNVQNSPLGDGGWPLWE